MKTNISLTKKWIKSAIADLERFLKGLKSKDFADAAFRSQFAIEKLNKSILVLLGLKIQKTHEPTKILRDVLKDKDFRKFDKKTEELIKKIISYSLLFEEEGTKTRYGVYNEDNLLIPEEIYCTLEDIKDFISNLDNIISLYIKLIQDTFQITEKELEDINTLKKVQEDIIKWI